MKTTFGLAFAISVICLGCVRGRSASAPEVSEGASEPRASVANPASTRCVERGGELEILDVEGGQIGVCVFDDGSRCEEWRFFRGECAPGECREREGRCDVKERGRGEPQGV